MMTRPLGGSADAAASPAASRCPKAGDLPGGIRIAYLGGVSEVYRAGPANAVIVNGYTDGRNDWRMIFLHGVFMARFVMIQRSESGEDGAEDPDSLSVHTFPDAALAPPVPRPGARWQGVVPITRGGRTVEEVQVHRAGPLEQITVAGCQYDGFHIEVDFGKDAAYREKLVYLPSLGIGYVAEFATNSVTVLEEPVTLLETLE